jgi:hypothetical protein
MFGLKNALVNFGLDILVKKGFALLEGNKELAISTLNNIVQTCINSLNVQQISSFGVDPKIAAALKDKGEIFVQAIISILVTVIIHEAESLGKTLVAKMKG